MQPLEQKTRPRGAGGTPGGIGELLLGLGMAVAGGYWLTSSVTVSSGYWTFWGHNAFGLSLVPLVLGCGILFFNGKSIRRMAHDVRRGRDHRGRDHHEPASISGLRVLFDTMLMLVLLAGGIRLVARSLRPH